MTSGEVTGGALLDAAKVSGTATDSEESDSCSGLEGSDCGDEDSSVTLIVDEATASGGSERADLLVEVTLSVVIFDGVCSIMIFPTRLPWLSISLTASRSNFRGLSFSSARA